MSYETLKRVLGESSLERKCRLLFGGVLLALIGGSFYGYGSLTEGRFGSQTREQVAITGRLLINPVLLKAHWKKFEQDAMFRPVIEELFKGLDTGELRKYEWRLATPSTPVPELGADVTQLLKGRDERVQPVPGKERDYLYLRAVRAGAACFSCHRPGSKHLNPANTPTVQAEGDLLAVAVIRFPTVSNDWNRAWFISFAIVTTACSMIGAHYIVRYVIVKPLKHLKDVSEAVSRGNLAQRSEISSGDEFEELSHAFNRMLRSLIDMQQQLRRVNDDLDRKVDQLAQANMALFEMNRLKSDFLATVSHELRTPLNSILGFSDVLSAGEQLTEKQRRWASNIQSSGRRLLGLINDILDLARIESGKMELRPEEFSMLDLVDAVVSMVRPLAEKKNIDLTAQVSPTLPVLLQDSHKIKQILENLLSNAVKFTPDGGRIDVLAQEDADMLVLSVADNGVGIAESDTGIIFEKFRQGSAARSGDDWAARDVPGSGLGLSIVKELCRLLDGEVTVQSQLGRGSTFTVRLPMRLSEKTEFDESAKQPWPTTAKVLA